MTNLVDVIEHLKPVQKEFLFNLVRRYFDQYENLHAWQLPFLSAADAVLALKIHEQTLGMVHIIDDSVPPTVGQRYIKQIISVIERHIPHPLVHLSHEKVRMQLADDIILKRYHHPRQRWTGGAFNITIPLKDKPVVSLRARAHRNTWDVTMPRQHVEAITLWLAENLR